VTRFTKTAQQPLTFTGLCCAQLAVVVKALCVHCGPCCLQVTAIVALQVKGEAVRVGITGISHLSSIATYLQQQQQ
jgi:hypothetical protein